MEKINFTEYDFNFYISMEILVERQKFDLDEKCKNEGHHSKR